VNLLAAAVPVGTDPAAEAEALEGLLSDAAVAAAPGAS
jgi:hypothetical protein